MKDREQPEQTTSEAKSPGPAKSNGKDIYIVDPNGFTVSLSMQTWEKHIIAGHPELRDLLNIVTQTLQEPEIVIESASQEGIFLYYRLTGRRILRHNDLFMAVVVRRDKQTKTGIVKTAYVTKETKKEGGKLVWFKRV